MVDVQVDVSAGLPSFEIVGLPDATIKESKERVRTAIRNSGFNLFSRKILINLAPASRRKEGTMYDLAMAIGILCSNNYINREDLKKTVFIGELSLDGRVGKVNGILPMCIELEKLGIERVILPKDNAAEASVVSKISIIPVTSLMETVRYLNNEIQIENYKAVEGFNLQNDNSNSEYLVDFSEVKGQRNIKRAVEVATSGGHNLLMIGSPGSGKTMIAKRIPTILPDLDFEESLEVTKIHSITGNLSENIPIITKRPFRSPHHTVTGAALVGGGKYPKPR